MSKGKGDKEVQEHWEGRNFAPRLGKGVLAGQSPQERELVCIYLHIKDHSNLNILHSCSAGLLFLCFYLMATLLQKDSNSLGQEPHPPSKPPTSTPEHCLIKVVDLATPSNTETPRLFTSGLDTFGFDLGIRHEQTNANFLA